MGTEIQHGIGLPEHPYGPILGTVMAAEAGAAFRELIDSGRMREMATVPIASVATQPA